MSLIETNLNHIKSQLPSNCQLIVVSKYRQIEEIQEVYRCGQRVFAENRVQALLERKEALPDDIQWHLIGHLQTNKVKYIADFIHLIHSVDSYKLAKEIDLQAKRHNRIIDILLQTHVAQEDSKFGVKPSEFDYLVQEILTAPFNNIRVRGIMGMASFTENQEQIHQEFKTIQRLFLNIKEKYFGGNPTFSELSIGMSSDYPLALQHQSTMVRIGSAVFEP